MAREPTHSPVPPAHEGPLFPLPVAHPAPCPHGDPPFVTRGSGAGEPQPSQRWAGEMGEWGGGKRQIVRGLTDSARKLGFF